MWRLFQLGFQPDWDIARQIRSSGQKKLTKYWHHHLDNYAANSQNHKLAYEDVFGPQTT